MTAQPDALYVPVDVLALVERLDGYESEIESFDSMHGHVRKGRLSRHGLKVIVDLKRDASTGRLSCSGLGSEGAIEFTVKE